MLEIWLDIEGYEGLYMVSNMGRVKSLNYNHTGKEIILKPGSTSKYGYKQVGLYKNGGRVFVCVHQLVAQTFIPNPENKPCIDHIDTNPTNNCVYNLRWVTHHENNQNPLTIEHNKQKSIYCFETDKNYESTKDVERQLNVHSGSVSRCCKGLRKSAGGYHFKYYEKGEA